MTPAGIAIGTVVLPAEGDFPLALGEAGAAPYDNPALKIEVIAQSIPAAGKSFEFIVFPISVVCYSVLGTPASFHAKWFECFTAITRPQNVPPLLAQRFDFVLIF